MARWIRLKSTSETPIYVNVDNAMSIHRGSTDKFTMIAFPGDKDDVVKVRETPEEIMKLVADR